MILPARSQLIRELSLTPTDLAKIARCRGDPQRLGFAYQLGFVRVFQRFPVQQPLEICEELLSFSALQTGIDSDRLSDSASWQQTVSRHPIRIREYLGLRSFDPGPARGLEPFLYEEPCRLEQPAALLARAREHLKREGTLFPAEGLPGSSENSAGRREKRSPQGWRDRFHGRSLRRSASCWKWTRTRAYPGSSGSRRTQPSHLQLRCGGSLRNWRRSRRQECSAWTWNGSTETTSGLCFTTSASVPPTGCASGRARDGGRRWSASCGRAAAMLWIRLWWACPVSVDSFSFEFFNS